jgi:acyl-CoA dehydrogenase
VAAGFPTAGDRAATRRPVPPFTDEHEQLRESVRRFVTTELRPHADDWERDGWFPNSVFERCAELGMLGLQFPEEYGGQGGDAVAGAVFAEEFARCGSGGVAAGIGAHSGIASPPVFKFGTEDQKQRYLVPAIAAEKIAALAITEPGAGSDVAGLRTRAERVDGGWLVNGEKTYITNGVRADFLVTAVRTDAGDDRHQGISFLIVDRGEGVTSSKLDKLGWRASDTATVSFEDVFVPEENLLGEEGRGFYLVMANFQWERLAMALGAIGAMTVALEAAFAYALEREAFGRPIGRHQAIRHKLAWCATELEVARAMTYHALRLHVSGQECVREVTMAKLATQRRAVDVIDECLQVHGAAGYMREYGIERMLRDARLGPIGGGTDEIMKEILGRSMGL